MTVPLVLLAVGAVVTGFGFAEQMLGHDWMAFWGSSIQLNPANQVLHEMHDVPELISLAPTAVGLLGIGLAYLFYMLAPGIPVVLAATFGAIHRFLLNKWYFDELYGAVIVRPLLSLARTLWVVADTRIIDGMPNGVASLTADGSAQVVKLQTGSIAHYAFAMLIGVVFLVTVYLFIR
jgi:NADH-quinone oxidoreductase subunit L